MTSRSVSAACVFVVLLVVSACTTSEDYLERGKKLFAAGKYEDASLSFRKAIQKDRKLGEAYYQLGLVEIRTDKFGAAFGALLPAVQFLPDNQQAKVALANVCIQLYNSDPRRPKIFYDQFVKLVAELGSRNPQGYDTLRFRGYLARIDRQLKDEIGYFEEANRVKPLQPEVVINLMQALIQDRQFGEAEKLGEQMIQKDSSNGPAYDVLYSAYMNSGDSQRAQDVLKEKVANNPKKVEYALQLANYYMRAQKSGEVPPIIKSLLDRAADSPELYLKIGDFYAGLGNWDEAIRQFDQGIGREPKNKILYRKRMTAVLVAQGKKAEAARMVDETLREAPQDPESLQLRAAMLLETGEPQDIGKALAQFEALSKQSPHDIPLRFNLGRAYFAKGDLTKARQEFLEALHDNPSMLQAHLLLAEIAYRQKDPNEILSQLAPVLAAQPANSRARLLHATALIGQGNAAAGRSELDRLIRDEPKYADAQIELGLFYLTQKKYQEAEAIFRKFYEPGRTNPQALEGLVTVLAVRDQMDQAVHLIDQEAKTSQQSSSLRFRLAKMAIQAGKEDVALQQLQQGLKEDPNAFDAYILLAEIYTRKGDVSQARSLADKARALSPKDVRPYILTAMIQDRAGERSQAIASYREALALRPNDPNLLNDVAYYFAENGGNLDEALEMALRAVDKLKGEDYASDTLAWIYLKKNMTGPALQILDTLVKKHPNAALFRYHLGAALAAKGDRARARAELGEALQKKPAKQDEVKIRELLARLG